MIDDCHRVVLPPSQKSSLFARKLAKDGSIRHGIRSLREWYRNSQIVFRRRNHEDFIEFCSPKFGSALALAGSAICISAAHQILIGLKFLGLNDPA